jgi:hypothetical protein
MKWLKFTKNMGTTCTGTFVCLEPSMRGAAKTQFYLWTLPCRKGDFDGAIQQYLKTIGRLEPSYVIRKVCKWNVEGLTGLSY